MFWFEIPVLVASYTAGDVLRSRQKTRPIDYWLIVRSSMCSLDHNHSDSMVWTLTAVTGPALQGSKS